MKRMISLMLAVMMILTLAACGEEPEPTETVPATIPETTEVVTEAPTEPPVTEAEAENVLVDNESCTFAVVGASTNDYTGMELRVRCANKTEGTVVFSWDAVSVCGFMYDPMWSQEVAPGETVESVVSIDTFRLEEYGIESVDEISFRLNVFDSESWMDAPYVSDYFSIYPTGLDAQTVPYPQRRPVAEETVVLDNDSVRFIIERAEVENEQSYILHCYIVNKTDTALMFTWENVTVNGAEAYPGWAVTVAPGKQACSDVVFFRSELPETVDEIGFDLIVYDYDGAAEAYVVEESFMYQPTNDAVFG